MPIARLRFVLAAAFATALFGCASSRIPDPKVAVRAFEAAAARGDAASVYALLTNEARREFGVARTAHLLADARVEIAARARGLRSDAAVIRSSADVTYVDGEHARLEIEHGQYRISAAAGLPSAPRTPAEALGELRAALARRSYAALVRVLSKGTRGALEGDLGSMVQGLEHPGALDVKTHGGNAEVVVPGGHKVWLEREGGSWRIRDFD